MHSGIPKVHNLFWEKFSVAQLFDLYRVMNATIRLVLDSIDEPEFCSKSEERVFHFFITFIGNCNTNFLRQVLRFITGSSVIVGKIIAVSFHSLSGLARRPISHTCSCTLELSTSYTSYLEFEKEMFTVLSSDSAFIMDTI